MDNGIFWTVSVKPFFCSATKVDNLSIIQVKDSFLQAEEQNVLVSEEVKCMDIDEHMAWTVCLGRMVCTALCIF